MSGPRSDRWSCLSTSLGMTFLLAVALLAVIAGVTWLLYVVL